MSENSGRDTYNITDNFQFRTSKERSTLVHASSDPNFIFSLSQNREPLKNLQDWVQVRNKRRRSPNLSNNQPTLKQTKIENYWLGAPKVSNQFQSLEGIEDENITDIPPREPKPPPLFVDGVEFITPLYAKLNEVAKDQYTLKVQGTDRVKIQPSNKDAFSSIFKALEDKGTQFHTYETKANRAFRVVLRNMHQTTDIKEIEKILKVNGHVTRNIHNIIHRGTKKPLPMFFVDLEPNQNNKDIYKIEYLLHQKIKFEAPHIKREIPQCLKCQRYGHTKKFCHHNARCVKCMESHETVNCNRKVKDANVLCVLCEGNHPANYKGCSVYRELRDKSFPTLRKKGVHGSQNEIPNARSSKVRPNISYAQIAREQSQQEQFVHNITQVQPSSSNGHSNDISELKQMMKDLMLQMGTMLNLLTTIVSKIK